MSHKLFAVDCAAGMKALPAGVVDLVVTSPPYNLGKKYSLYSDNLKKSEYVQWTAEWIRELERVLKDDGSFFLNIGSAAGVDTLLPFAVLQCCTDNSFLLQNTFHWIKSISIDRSGTDTVSYGHFKPINSPRFVNDCHEYVFHLTKHRNVALDRKAVGVPYQDKSNIKRWGHSDGADVRCRGNCWFIPYKTITNADKDRPHPATFPVELAEMCIRITGRSGMTMLDPFVGIGSSAVAAKNCADQVAEFIGFDIDSSYIEEAEKRLKL